MLHLFVSLIFVCHIANENQAIKVYRPTTDEGERRGNSNKIRFGILEDQYDWPRHILILIFYIQP